MKKKYVDKTNPQQLKKKVIDNENQNYPYIIINLTENQYLNFKSTPTVYVFHNNNNYYIGNDVFVSNNFQS